jgi:CelD/BcsL family acetyltransferase involved in cellulose biosynthesis
MSQSALATAYSTALPVARAATADRLHVEIRHEASLDGADARALDALIEARPYVGVFLTPAWLSGFFAEPPPGTALSLLLFRQGATLRGTVPVAIRRTRTHVIVSLIGGGLGSDRVDLLAARGFEALVADTFLTWLVETFGPKGFLLELRDVPATSSIWGAVQRAGIESTLQYALQPKEVYTLPYLTLPASTPASNDSPSGDALRSLSKHRRWLEHRCHPKVARISSAERALSAFDDLIRLLRARWSGAILSALDNPAAVRRHRRVLPLLLADGRLRMFEMTADGRTIAVFYGIAAAGWWGYYLAGYDREWAGRIRLGQIVLATAIDQATAEGATEFDFLKGAERLKYVWPVRERATIDADLFSAASGPQLARARRATRDAAAALTKSARHFLPVSRTR